MTEKLDRKGWNALCLSWKNKWAHEYTNKKTNDTINLYEVIGILNKNVDMNTIMMADAGSPSYAMPQTFYPRDESIKCIYSTSQADMGFALPASIGVALANPDKQIIAVIGDGSFMSNLQELSTIAYHNLNIIFLVINNNGYISIRNTQSKFFNNRVSGTSVKDGVAMPHSFNKIAMAFDFNYYCITTREELKDMMHIIDKHSTPTIIEIFTNVNEEVIPAQAFKDGKQAGLDDLYPFLNEKELEGERNKCM